ncbi:hypothetical protein [Streptomyces sp. NPDC088182]|uniref:hypothetical protein n=2 Tax=unclassified Streptomyces TaxID=2593676 RepID=UPI0037F96002
MRTWNAVRSAGMMLIMALGVAACGSDDEEPRYISIEEVCDGIFSGDAARAAEIMIGDKTVSGTRDDTLEKIASSIKELYADGQNIYKAGGYCKVGGKGGGDGEMDINFGLYRADDVLTPYNPEKNQYRLGKRAFAGSERSKLYFECASPEIKGSDNQPARIYAISRLANVGSWEVEDTRATREAHLTVLHAAALAVAKELGCENNGGLPEKVVLEPIADPVEPSGAPAT